MVGPTQRVNALEDEVLGAVASHGGLAHGEVVTHFDLVVETRLVDACGHEHIRRHHWAPIGSDPHLSYAVLAAEASRVLNTISTDR